MSCAYLTRFFCYGRRETELSRCQEKDDFSLFFVFRRYLYVSSTIGEDEQQRATNVGWWWIAINVFFSFCSFLWPFLSSDSFESQRDRRKRQTGFRCEQRTLNEQRPSTPLPPMSFLLFERTRTKQLVASTDRTVGEQRFQFVWFERPLKYLLFYFAVFHNEI